MKKIIDNTNKAIKLFAAGKEYQSLEYFHRAYSAAIKHKDEILADAFNTSAYNYGLTLLTIGNYKKAIEIYEQLPEDHHYGKYEQSLCLFHLNRVSDAMKLYVHRIGRDTHDSPKFPKLPLIAIDETHEFEDKTVLVLNEQGFGDELLFSRALVSLSSIVKHANVQVYPELIDVFNERLKLKNITYFSDRSMTADFVKQHDAWTTSGTIWTLWYNNPIYFERKHPQLSDGKIHIGFVTSPNKLSKNAADRAVDPECFARLKSDSTTLHNLSIAGPDFDFAIDHRKELVTFNDTLKLIEQMSIVVTVDTGVAHLAALSKTPTILVYDKYLDWRWTNNFYPNVNIVHKDKLTLELVLRSLTHELK
jgi:tetratricopeptide (TPR) repeat protein